MQSYSSYNEQSMNFSNINGVKDIKEYNMNYHKKNNNLGLGELNIRDNNVKEKILFNDNNMMDVAAYLKNKRNMTRKETFEKKLRNLLKTKKKRIKKKYNIIKKNMKKNMKKSMKKNMKKSMKKNMKKKKKK